MNKFQIRTINKIERNIWLDHYLQLDLDAEAMVAERAVENGLELGLGLWRLYLSTLLLCHRQMCL